VVELHVLRPGRAVALKPVVDIAAVGTTVTFAPQPQRPTAVKTLAAG
jgi:hypothetical protein